jgi:transcriptional regulator with XRE-family HTH domain
MNLKEYNEETPGQVDVGCRLREIRSEHGLSISALAEKSGLNVNTVSLIENDKTSPSVSTLQKISVALEIPISTFFETRLPKTNIVFQKEAQRPHTRFTHGTMDNLSANLGRKDLEPFQVTLAPKSGSGRNMMVHTGLELVYCLDGN